MKTTNTGGPAFPIPYECSKDPGVPGDMELHGMTLRDYFAIRAFQTRLAKYNDWTLTELTEQSYLDADAMLKARKPNKLAKVREPLNEEQIEQAYRQIYRNADTFTHHEFVEAGIRYAEKAHRIGGDT